MYIVKIFLFFCFVFTSHLHADLFVGKGSADITPPIGTPSAGYFERVGKGMVEVHDPLRANAVIIDNGNEQIVFCQVDHLGFDYEMVQMIKGHIKAQTDIDSSHIFISSTHTHSGGGAYLNIPIIGDLLAGKFDPSIRDLYVNGAVQAIVMAWNSKQPAKIGIGYSTVKGITKYRSKWPENVQTADQLMVMKMTNIDNTPLCVLYNFALHPTTLSAKNYSFSADFVNFAAKELRKKLGDKTLTLFINGAQAELIPPERATSESEWDQCASIGSLLAREVKFVWEKINPSENLAIAIVHQPYSFKVKPTSRGLKLPLETYHSELNCILLNKNVLLTIPGELSCVYEQEFRKAAQDLGMENLSVLGLTNDAHGYIILPEAWEKKTQESELSFGGKNYGSDFKELAKKILQRQFEVLEKARL